MKRGVLIAVGVVLLVLVAVLVVPALIDWSRYKDDISARIEDATGRQVTIAGDVGLRLLPSPAFTAERLAIGNAPGAGDEPFATAEELALRLRLLPLLTGKVEVESLSLSRPVVNLARLPEGGGNWQFTPAAKPSPADPPEDGTATEPADSDDSDGISIGTVVVRNGLITYREGESPPLRIDDLDARLEAGGPTGPFKVNGSLTFRDAHATFDGALDRIAQQRGSTARLAVQILEADARAEFSGLLSQLSGGPTLRGKLTVTAPDLRRLSAVADVPATLPLPTGTGLRTEGTLVAGSDHVALSDLVMTLGDARATGSVTVGLGEVTKVDARLALASLDLDKWLAAVPVPKTAADAAPPAPAADRLPGAGPAPAPPAADFSLPKDLFVDLGLGIEAVSWRGAVIQDARVQATLDSGELVLNGATAQLPGGSVVSLAGVLAPVAGRPVFDGQTEVRSDNLRALLTWLGVDTTAIPPDGLRRLDASANLRAAWPEIGLQRLDLRLDTTHATGGLTARMGARPAYGLRLAVDSLNLDRYLPSDDTAKPPAGAPAASPPARQPAPPAGQAGAPLEAATGFDADLRLSIAQLTMNSMPAEDVRLAGVLNDGTLTVSQASAQLAGSRASASGILRDLGQPAPRAENVVLRVESPQPARLFRFLGVSSPIEPERLGGLTASVRADGDWQSMAVQAQAEAGSGLTLSANGTLASPLAQPRATLTVRAAAPSLTQAVRLFSPAYRPSGTVGAVALSAAVDAGPQAVALSNVVLTAGPARLTGEGRVALDGPRPMVTARLAANAIVLDPFMPAERTGFLLPGSPRLPPSLSPIVPTAIPAANGGGGPWSREPLSLDGLQAFDADVAVQAEALTWQGWTLASPRTALVVNQGIATMDNLTGKLLGGDMTASARLASGGIPSLAGSLAIAGANISQARLGAGGIQVTQGRLAAETQFAAAGRSSYDMAQSLKGTGRLTVTDGMIQGFDLPAVNNQLQNIENIGSLLGLLNAGLSRGTTKFSKLAGTFAAESGVITTRDLRLDAEGGTATAEAVVRLPPWTMTTAIAFQLAGARTPPAIVRLEGPIDNPRKIIDINALQQHLVARGLGKALKGKDAGKLIEGLLGGRGSQQQAPASDQQPQEPAKPDPGRLLQDLLKGLGR